LRSKHLLCAMLFTANRGPTPAPPLLLERFAFDLKPPCCVTSLKLTSLASSDCASSLLSNGWRADLKLDSLSSLGYAKLSLPPVPYRMVSYHVSLSCGGGVFRGTAPSPHHSQTRFPSRNSEPACGHIPDLLSRSIPMRFENDHEAANVFRLDVPVLHAASPRRAPARIHNAAAGGRPPLKPHATLREQTAALRREDFLPRCGQKGCVFPAQPGGDGQCAHHRRQCLEPGCFQSQQPSFLLLDQAKFGLPDSEPDDGRVRDRHRLASERVRFMLEDGA